MAARRADDIGSRSLMRSLAGVRGFARYLERAARARSARSPRCGRRKSARPCRGRSPPLLPKAWPIPIARAGDEPRAVDPRPRCRGAGVALRQRPAHLRGAGPKARRFRRARRCLTVTGKGRKQRMVPLMPQVAKLVADYLALCPTICRRTGPLFVGAKGGPLSPRVVQLAMARLRGALGLPETATPHALRHSFATHLLGPRRRPALDPGTARPRLAVDDADLYRGRRRAADRGLSRRPSARVT